MSNDQRKQKKVFAEIVNTEPIPVEATIDTTGLATDTGQAAQITNQGAAGTAAPFGSGMLGWLRGIYERLSNITNLTFTGGDLNVAGSFSIATGGANAAVTTVSLTDSSAVALASDSDRKQFTIYNDTGKEAWIFYGTPAVFGTGIHLDKKQSLIEDKYTGQVTAIMDAGQSGDIQVTDVTV